MISPEEMPITDITFKGRDCFLIEMGYWYQRSLGHQQIDGKLGPYMQHHQYFSPFYKLRFPAVEPY